MNFVCGFYIGLKGNPLPTKYLNLCNDSNGLQNLLGFLLDSLGGMVLVFIDMLDIGGAQPCYLFRRISFNCVHVHNLIVEWTLLFLSATGDSSVRFDILELFLKSYGFL